jgi:hypothetical protein
MQLKPRNRPRRPVCLLRTDGYGVFARGEAMLLHEHPIAQLESFIHARLAVEHNMIRAV